MSLKINTLIIEDDPHWQATIGKLVKLNSLLETKGVCSTAMEAYAQLAEHDIDLLICDIELPDMSGLEFVRSLKQPPLVIFITAHRDYALVCYELSPVDFLLKPIEPARFLASIESVRQRLLQQVGSTTEESYFFIRDNQYYVQIRTSEVLYMQAQENVLRIVTTKEVYTPFVSITKMEEQLNSDVFVRVHRSYLVNRAAISRISKSEIMLTSGQMIPVGEQYSPKIYRSHVEGKVISRT